MGFNGNGFLDTPKWSKMAYIYMNYIWTIYELYMNCIWTIYELYMHYIWTIYELYIPWSITPSLTGLQTSPANTARATRTARAGVLRQIWTSLRELWKSPPAGSCTADGSWWKHQKKGNGLHPKRRLNDSSPITCSTLVENILKYGSHAYNIYIS